MRGILFLALASSTLVAAAPQYGCKEKSVWCDVGDADSRIFFYCVDGKVSESACVTGTICSEVSSGIECVLKQQPETVQKSRKLGKRATADEVKDSALYKQISSILTNLSTGSSSKVRSDFDALTALIKSSPDQASDYLQVLTSVADLDTDLNPSTLFKVFSPYLNNTVAATNMINTVLKGLQGNENRAAAFVSAVFSSLRENENLKEQYINYLFMVRTQVVKSKYFELNTSDLKELADTADSLIKKVFGCTSKLGSTVIDSNNEGTIGDILQQFFDGDIDALTSIVDSVLDFSATSPQILKSTITSGLKILSSKTLGIVSLVVNFVFGAVEKNSKTFLELVEEGKNNLLSKSFFVSPITSGVMFLYGLDGVCIGDVLYNGVAVIITLLTLGTQTF
ncbi:hypothetical protein AX774_g7588 [Zancudomyces culisetae]|uniref:Uncharacterized protein n=1 Tax=Zancudomyces culisetae TaxID=1213189 RepID=A0A1R1PDE3_ZANCU|nr:hypothetical protein AX774_g7588 [Zancudomyces culisetae]|eukprot:OMH79015.1 hypothetical protein AX774_g7588 [Zancudomyces culisetae]